MNLQNKYSRDEFIDFIKSFVPNFQKDVRGANTRGLKVTREAHFLGESPDLDLAIFELKHTSTSDARVTLATEGFRLMKDSANYRALIAYVPEKSDDWRLSLMTAIPDTTEKGKVILKLSNPRRYSFFLGENAKVNTPHKFLVRQGAVTDFEDLQKRFSLEVVNKEFYKQISESFIKLVGGTLGTGKNEKKYKALLKLPSVGDHSQTSLEFGVRLIGRLIFCWFLREKKSPDGEPLMPDKLLSLEAIEKHSDYYHQVLEPIFFEVLNKPAKSRKDDYTGNSFASVPYLNGGLFSPHYDDFFSYNSGKQAVNHNTVVVPDSWFEELFKTLETYNFTIDENTSFDEELSIDPEMLGRIFENLLAEINPETGESARKSTGSYYTPRVIVDYMVDESLVLYLKEQTGIDEGKIRAVVSYDLTDDTDHPLTSGEKSKILDALENLKLLDPACGSGAFPIGALQKIVFILQQLDPEGQMWFKKQLKKTSPELRRVLEREFENQNFDYIRKLGIIRENIYGVDIQPIATEISRLRCFLTLIVDQNVKDEEENRGIQPLPNLDFKFVTANSLIGLPKIETNQQTMFDDYRSIDELKQIRDQYFTASGIEREQLKTEFVTQQKRLVDQLITEHGWTGVIKAELTQKLTNWEPFSHKPSDWFDPEWMFGTDDGFDIVIANPPYISYYSKSQKTAYKSRDEVNLMKKHYSFVVNKKIRGRLNSMSFFVERGLRILHTNGVLSYIVDTSINEKASQDIRRFIINNASIVEIVYNLSLFENVTSDQSLIFLSNKKKPKSNLFKWKHKFLSKYLKFEQGDISERNGYSFYFSKHESLLKKIELDRPQLSSFVDHAIGVQIGGKDMNFNGKKIRELFLFDENKSGFELYKNIINIEKYSKPKTQGFINFDLDLGTEVNKNVRDANIALPNSLPYVKQRKIILRQSSSRLVATIASPGETCEHKFFQFKMKADHVVSLEYILGLINSSLLTFYAWERNIIKHGVKKQPQIRIKEIVRLPIAVSSESSKSVECLVNMILDITDSDDYYKSSTKQLKVKDYEKQIDQIVYKLYGLTDEEIKIVEGEFHV